MCARHRLIIEEDDERSSTGKICRKAEGDGVANRAGSAAMNDPALDDKTFSPLESTWRLAALGKWTGLLLAFGMVAMVAVADYVTGYEERLSILYMLPIALATWTGGMRPGALTAMMSGGCWLVSFRSNNIYSDSLFYYWEGVVLMVTFLIFVLLLARLRSALERADERFVRVLEGLYAGVYVADESSGRMLYSNQRLARMVGADPLSMPAAEVERRFSTSRAGVDEYLKRPPLAAEASGFVSEEVRDERSDRWYLVQSGAIPWEHGQQALLKVFTDITEQKQAQILKQQHLDMLHEVSRSTALTEIASMLAHEINQPLMAIASYIEACLRLLANAQCDTGEVVAALEKCRVQAVRAGQIISRTRDFIRRRDPDPVRGNINQTIHEALQSIELELQDAEVAVDLRLDETLRPLPFDRTLIAQVLINLLHNAVDAMRPVAPSRRRLRITTVADSDGMVVVSVADQGAGIPEAAEGQLYTPFFTTKPQGLGLGLCICRSVIEAHAGRLWHSAVPGGGMAFHFMLPCHEGE
jgi:C4-dicarboxylate-specific signal transduction histidine kinase